MTRSVKAFAPVSIGNGVVGFDTLGIAVRPIQGGLWGDVVEVRAFSKAVSEGFSLSVKGKYASSLPKDPKRNLVYFVAKEFIRRLGQHKRPSFHITLEKRLPIFSGLGSSGASAAAAVFALNEYFRRPFREEELLDLASYGERKGSGSLALDNVAPALFGGVCLVRDSPLQGVVRLPWPKQLLFAFCRPKIEISTRQSRSALSKKIALNDAVLYWRNLALFISALCQKDEKRTTETFFDSLIEPQRARQIPGFYAAQQAAIEAGAFGCSLSGSGPSTVALCKGRAEAKVIATAMRRAYRKFGLNSETQIAQVDLEGARLI